MTETFDDLTPKERRLIRAVREVLSKKWKDAHTVSADDLDAIVKSPSDVLDASILDQLSNKDPRRLLNLAIFGIHPYEGPFDGSSKEFWRQGKLTDTPPHTSPQAVFSWVLHQMHPLHEQAFLDALDEISPGISRNLEYKSEPFDFLLKLDKYAIRRVLREVDTRELACALIDTVPAIKALIYSNMSKRAAQMMEEDIQYIGKLDKKSIAISQRRIIQITQRLIAEGQMTRDAEERYTVNPVPSNLDDKFYSDYSGNQQESMSDEYAKKPLLFKIILFSSLAVTLIAIVVLVSWKVTKLQLDMERKQPPAVESGSQNPAPEK